jgi:hypothetical protein
MELHFDSRALLMEERPMRAKWFTDRLDACTPPRGFLTRKAAVSDAQSDLDTNNRPRRIEHGMLILISKTGHTCYIGKPESFRLCGFEWGYKQIKRIETDGLGQA